MPHVRIGVDTGGTFTDVLMDRGDGQPLTRCKLPSTPDDPARAVIDGIGQVIHQADLAAGAGEEVIHGSTVATNALLEGKGARAAFVTTAGFEDIVFLARQNRPQLYDLNVRKPQPPLDSADCFGVKERMRLDGKVLEPLALDEIEGLVGRIRESGAAACCICLLHSYANPAHEQALAEGLRGALPELHLTVSSELLPEFREYERAATCLANAVVGPVMDGYLARLSEGLPGARLRIMASSGGSLPVETIRRAPVQTILSGPAGGVHGAMLSARPDGVTRFISFDMGGTSTDVALCDGQVGLTNEFVCANLPVRLPVTDIHTVGAGGGSVAWLDSGGALHVGPQSMGADPGPACYGRQSGELIPTVTDAHVVLGHIPPWLKLAGSLELDTDAAQSAVSALAKQCGLGLHETAEGILRVAESTMARAIKEISVERGHDARRFALMPFGGAGGLHAARLASQLGISEIHVPADPGLLSAMGMLGAGPVYNFSRTVMARIAPGDRHTIEESTAPTVFAAFAELEQRAKMALSEEGIGRNAWVIERRLDVRYAGQSYELTVGEGDGGFFAGFEAEHERLYGYVAREREIEVVNARVFASAPLPEIAAPQLPRRESGSWRDDAREGTIHGEGQKQRCWFADRGKLLAGDMIIGPAVVTEYSATTLIPQGWTMRVAESGALRMTLHSGGGGG